MKMECMDCDETFITDEELTVRCPQCGSMNTEEVS